MNDPKDSGSRLHKSEPTTNRPMADLGRTVTDSGTRPKNQNSKTQKLGLTKRTLTIYHKTNRKHKNISLYHRMSLFQQAARLNNKGIAALISGHHQLGVETLGQSIKVLKRLLIAPNMVTTDWQSSSSNDISAVSLPMHQACRDSSIFNQAFEIPEDEEKTTLRDIRVYASAVTFNSALAHQLRGDRRCLEKAETLYQMSIKLLECNSYQQDSCTSLVLQLASVNNLSLVHLDLSGDMYQCNNMATEAVRQVHGFVSMVRSNGSDGGGIFLEDPLIQDLLMNVLLLKAPQVAPAA